MQFRQIRLMIVSLSRTLFQGPSTYKYTSECWVRAQYGKFHS